MALNEIGIFKLDKSKTTMKYGYHYKALIDLPYSNEKRHIRVWLPENYDFEDNKKTFPVIYFSDGQNLVNKYLTAFGDWGLDKVAHMLYKEKGISFIAVGIDCPKDDKTRGLELAPPYLPTRYRWDGFPYADKFVDFIADDLRELINKLFHTKKDRKSTGIGGSSMGGIMAFYGAARQSDIFGFSLDFSPAFFLYNKDTWLKMLNDFDIKNKKNTKFFLYVGGKDYESMFVSNTLLTYKYMVKNGFDQDNLALIYDSRQIHHESAWNKYLGEAIEFWQK